MLRVMHVIGAMDRAGAETFLMNLYRTIDRSNVQFDFLVHAQNECDYDKEIEDLGGRIFHIPRYNVINKKSYSEAVRNVLRNHPEDRIVHSHIGSSAPVHLTIAQQEKRFTVAHSHRQTILDSLENIVFLMLSKPVRGKADWYMACSKEAAVSRFGNSIAAGDKCTIIKNGIPVRSYTNNEELTSEAKREFGVTGVPVFGHVGRFVTDKNHEFLLKVFAEVQHALPEAVLLLAGRGELEGKIRKATDDISITKHVKFLGPQDDVAKALRAFDVFLFPSLHEGLGISLVEAQAIGLECIASTGVPESAICTDRAKRVPLDSSGIWAKEAIAAYERSLSHADDRVDDIAAAGYDISQTARYMQDFYLSHQ